MNQIGNIEEIKRRDNGNHVLKRVVELTDTTGEKLELRLWGSDVEEKIRESMAQEKTILLLHNVLKDEYAGYPTLKLSRHICIRRTRTINAIQCVSMQIKFGPNKTGTI